MHETFGTHRSHAGIEIEQKDTFYTGSLKQRKTLVFRCQKERFTLAVEQQTRMTRKSHDSQRKPCFFGCLTQFGNHCDMSQMHTVKRTYCCRTSTLLIRIYIPDYLHCLLNCYIIPLSPHGSLRSIFTASIPTSRATAQFSSESSKNMHSEASAHSEANSSRNISFSGLRRCMRYER